MSDERVVTKAVIHIEVHPKSKARWVATASREKSKLANWIEETLNANSWFDDEAIPDSLNQGNK